MTAGGHVFKAFMMCLLCGRYTPGRVVFTKRRLALELLALSEWFEKARQGASQRWIRFNLINPAPEESDEKAKHAVLEAIKMAKLGIEPKIGWVGH